MLQLIVQPVLLSRRQLKIHGTIKECFSATSTWLNPHLPLTATTLFELPHPEWNQTPPCCNNEDLGALVTFTHDILHNRRIKRMMTMLGFASFLAGKTFLDPWQRPFSRDLAVVRGGLVLGVLIFTCGS